MNHIPVRRVEVDRSSIGRPASEGKKFSSAPSEPMEKIKEFDPDSEESLQRRADMIKEWEECLVKCRHCGMSYFVFRPKKPGLLSRCPKCKKGNIYKKSELSFGAGLKLFAGIISDSAFGETGWEVAKKAEHFHSKKPEYNKALLKQLKKDTRERIESRAWNSADPIGIIENIPTNLNSVETGFRYRHWVDLQDWAKRELELHLAQIDWNLRHRECMMSVLSDTQVAELKALVCLGSRDTTNIVKILSNGMPGVARGALDAAMERDVPNGGEKASGMDDCVPSLVREYSQCIERNIADSDATLIYDATPWPPKDRDYWRAVNDLPRELCQKYEKPYMEIASSRPERVFQWLHSLYLEKITLNVVGSFEKRNPGIQECAKQLLLQVLDMQTAGVKGVWK